MTVRIRLHKPDPNNTQRLLQTLKSNGVNATRTNDWLITANVSDKQLSSLETIARDNDATLEHLEDSRTTNALTDAKCTKCGATTDGLDTRRDEEWRCSGCGHINKLAVNGSRKTNSAIRTSPIDADMGIKSNGPFYRKQNTAERRLVRGLNYKGIHINIFETNTHSQFLYLAEDDNGEILSDVMSSIDGAVREAKSSIDTIVKEDSHRKTNAVTRDYPRGKKIISRHTHKGYRFAIVEISPGLYMAQDPEGSDASEFSHKNPEDAIRDAQDYIERNL